jgi:Tol biopolymer transport system component
MAWERRASAIAGAVLVAAGLTACQPQQPWSSELVSRNAAGTGTGDSWSGDPDFSSDGTEVVFTSAAGDLGPTDSLRGDQGRTDDMDVYVRDLTTGTTTLVSANAAGTDSGNGASGSGDFSPDGTKVLFTSFANDLGPNDTERPSPGVPHFLDQDVYVRDLAAGTTTLVSANAAGTDSANGYSETPHWAGNDKVVFTSLGNDLGPADTERHFGTITDIFRQHDIYVRDLTTGTTTLVSANAAGSDSGNDLSSWPVVSADGTKVAFHSSADDLGPADHDREGNPFDFVAEQDLYVRDLTTGTTRLVSTNAAGTDSADRSTPAYQATFSPDSRLLAFGSYATDIATNDTNEDGDVFVHDLATGTNRLLSTNAGGTASADGLSQDPVFSPDSSEVAFTSDATDLGPADAGTSLDIYVRSLATGTTELISVNGAGTGGGGSHSFSTAFSPDGRRVAFGSNAHDLGPRDGNGTIPDIYVRDRDTATTTLVSATPGGSDSGNATSEDPELSPDGTAVLFASAASDLVDGVDDANVDRDVFLATLLGADLGVTLGADADAEAAAGAGGGHRLTYRLGVANGGPDPAEDVSAAVLVPEGATVDSAAGAGASCTVDTAQPRLVTCSLGTVDADASRSVAVEVTVDRSAPRPLVAFAAVRSSTVDPAYGDNSTAAIVD